MNICIKIRFSVIDYMFWKCSFEIESQVYVFSYLIKNSTFTRYIFFSRSLHFCGWFLCSIKFDFQMFEIWTTGVTWRTRGTRCTTCSPSTRRTATPTYRSVQYIVGLLYTYVHPQYIQQSLVCTCTLGTLSVYGAASFSKIF